MYLSDRVTKFAFIAVILWNFTLRYPLINGPHHNDGFVIMEYMVRIINHGKIVGILSPFSYVGAYPFSEPYGVPVFSAAALLVSGINIEWFTLFY